MKLPVPAFNSFGVEENCVVLRVVSNMRFVWSVGPPLGFSEVLAKPYELLPFVLIGRGIVNCGENAWETRGVFGRRTCARYISVAAAKMGGAIPHNLPLNQDNQKKVLNKLHRSQESEYNSYMRVVLLPKLTCTSNSKFFIYTIMSVMHFCSNTT